MDFAVKRGKPEDPESPSARMRKRIAEAIRRLPRGKVSTYGAVARAAGYPHAARQTVSVLRTSFGLPWHRVLGANGEIKLQGDNAIEQRLRLQSEGVRFRGRRVDMKNFEFRFPPQKSAGPKRSRKRPAI